MTRDFGEIPSYFADGIGNVFLNNIHEDRLAANKVVLCSMSIFAMQNNRDFLMIKSDDGILILPEYNFMIFRSGFAGVVKL